MIPSDLNEKDARISISHFAELVDISRDTLVYYIKERLIVPAVIEENGYQYFYPDQIRTMTFIKYMRRFGIHLNEIRDMLSGMDEDGIYQIMNSHYEEIEERIRKTTEALRFLNTIEEFIDFIHDHEVDVPFICELSEADYYLTPVRFCHSLNNPSNAVVLSDYLNFKDRGLPEYLLCCRIPEKVLRVNDFCSYMHAGQEQPVNRQSVITRPPGTYICMIHQGGNGTVRDTIMYLKDCLKDQKKEMETPI